MSDTPIIDASIEMGQLEFVARHLERQLAEKTRELEDLQKRVSDGNASDGYHTHKELYEYRKLYNAHAAIGWLAAGIPVVKSWKHSDGELCFGGGWFIVVATLPTGQVSNHYKAEDWDIFRVPEVSLPPSYDGHTPEDVAARLRDSIPSLPASDQWKAIAERLAVELAYLGTMFPLPTSAENALRDFEELGKGEE